MTDMPTQEPGRQLVFFYGLFMDLDLLRSQGLDPQGPTVVRVDDYGLRIGARATLVAAPGERAWGVAATLAVDELESLYSEASVADYRPEPVDVVDRDGQVSKAHVYNLPGEELAGRNRDYALKLVATASRLGLPPEYLDEIETWAQ